MATITPKSSPPGGKGIAAADAPNAMESRSGQNGLSSVIGALPRRSRINLGASTVSTLTMPQRVRYQASFLRSCRRLISWASSLAWFGAVSGTLKVVGRDSVTKRAVRLRKLLEAMGPTAIKVGQQLALRADLFPSQYCDELSKMLDNVAPFDTAEAIEIIEKTAGRPLSEVFETFDPQTIGSASLACVYQAKLKTGELVAVKVKRPGIGEQMAAELKAICWLCNMAEGTGVIRGGLTRNFQMELTRMLTEELDFELEARYTEIFRRDAKAFKYLSAPKVFHDLSNYDVLVTEFVSGLFLTEILYAFERKDRSSLRELTARGYRPKIISRRMIQIFYWECFESLFFHADPHPANIIVRPDNTIVMIDFGSCGAVSSKMRRKLLSFQRMMISDDISGMVEATISMIEPLPQFDVDRFCAELTNIFREMFLAHKSKHAQWYDKCSGGMWMKVIMLSNKYNLPMTLDTVRIFRANFLYDSIVYRLHSRLDPQREFRRWIHHWDRRNRQRVYRELCDRALGPKDADFTRQLELAHLFNQATERLQRYLDQPSYNFALNIGKVAYVISVLIKTAIILGVTVLSVTVGRLLYAWAVLDIDNAQPVAEALQWTINQKVVVLLLAVYSVIAIRKLLFRLEDVESK